MEKVTFKSYSYSNFSEKVPGFWEHKSPGSVNKADGT